MNWRVLVVAVALVVSAAGAPVAATGSGASQSETETVAGTHVEFGVSDTAIVDYTVDSDELIDEVAVQSESAVDGGVDGSVTGEGTFSGAGLTVEAGFDASTRARVRAETGALIEAHDNDRGVLTVAADETAHRVRFATGADTTARAVSDRRAVVESTDGTAAATVLLLGDGGRLDVSDGNVTASVGTRSSVVLRQYENGRTEDDRQQESLILNGSVASAVYVDATNEGTRVSSIPYGAVEADVTVDRGSRVDVSARQIVGGGSRPLLLSLSEGVLRDAGNATVTVDGSAVPAADGYAALRGGSAAVLIRESTSEPGRTDVLVDVEGYPAEVSVRTSNDGSDRGGDGATTDEFDGRNVAFRTADGAVRNYTVDGRTVVSDLRVQSASEARASAGLDIGTELGADTAFAGAGLSVAANASASTTLRAESGAEIRAHDNDRGVVVVRPGGEPHVARFGGGEGATAERESEKRAVVRRNGSSAAVIVVGEGNVSVAGGNVTARTDGDGRVVYRQYDGERSDSEREQERLIADGTAAAEVYLQAAGDAAESGAERTVDVVRYGANTTVDVTERSAERLNATVDRTESEGKVVLFSLQEAAFQNAGNATVRVDGEAAVRADSYAGVRNAVGGDRSAFLVRSSTSAEAAVDVVVGIDGFSARQVSIASGDGGADDTPTPTPTDGADEDTASDGDDGSDGSDGTSDGAGDGGAETTGSGGQPGFGVATAVLALAGAALLARRRP